MVVCAWTEERLELLKENIASLERQTLPPAEIIVAVDHNPELLALARDAFPDHLVVENREPRGASGPKNTALLHASGEVVAFIDDDAFADEHWLEAVAEAYEDGTTIGTGGRLTPIWVEGRPLWFPPEFDWVVGCSYRGEADGRTAVRNPIGANMSFRRDVFARTGGFSADLGRLRCEETEFAMRATARTGGWIMHVPDATVRHVVPAARATWSYFLRRCWLEGRSKAIVARRVGSEAALRRERSYVVTTVPSGLVRALRRALGGDAAGFGEAAAIVVGLAAAATAYFWGRASQAAITTLRAHGGSPRGDDATGGADRSSRPSRHAGDPDGARGRPSSH